MGGLVPPGDPASRTALRRLPETRGHPMSSSEFHHYTRDEFLAEFYPDPADKAAIAAGMEQLRAEQRAVRLAEMRRRLGITQTQVAARMGITQGRVSAIEHAKPGTTELRTLAAYVEALGGRLEIIADFGDQRLAFIEPGNEGALLHDLPDPGRSHRSVFKSASDTVACVWAALIRSQLELEGNVGLCSLAS